MKTQRLEKYSERFDNKDNELVEGIFNPENWGKRMVDDVAKQETLEEVAENFWLNDDSMTDNDRISYVNGFKQGAKWQQERSYSEEEVIDLLKALQIGYYIHNERVDIDKWFEQFKKK